MELPTGPERGGRHFQPREMWFQRFSRPAIFLIIAIALVGAYSAFTIPVSVFPSTDFPRIVIGSTTESRPSIRCWSRSLDPLKKP